jgi:hypothetical protein
MIELGENRSAYLETDRQYFTYKEFYAQEISQKISQIKKFSTYC